MLKYFRRFVLQATALVLIATWLFAGSAASQTMSSQQAAARDVVRSIMSAAIARCYSEVKGIRRITFVPATDSEIAQVKALGDDALAPLGEYLEMTPPDGFTQLFAVRFLAHVGTPSTLPMLERALAGDQWEATRATALASIYSISPIAASPYVKTALADKSAIVRQTAQRLWLLSGNSGSGNLR
jgi:hypothetical protein